MAEEPIFTIDEIKKIERNLGFITRDWHKRLIDTVIKNAINNGITHLFWNSSDTINAGRISEDKEKFFYEKLPESWGFKETTADLRGKGSERLWYLNLNNIKTASKEELIELSQVPKKYQGAAMGILRHRGPYTKAELKKVLEMVTSSKGKYQKPENFFYDIQEWTGGQRFDSNKKEMVFVQRLSDNALKAILNTGDPAFEKFISFIFSFEQHFGRDPIGFALVAPINQDTWLINEIQTDNINSYLNQKTMVEKNVSREKQKLNMETITDMLQARNKSVWIPKLENESFLNKIQENPNIIEQLPANDEVEEHGGIDAWLQKQKENQNTNVLRELELVAKKDNWYKMLKLSSEIKK